MRRLLVTLDDRYVLGEGSPPAELLSTVCWIRLSAGDTHTAAGNVISLANFQGTLADLETWVAVNATALLKEEPPDVLPPGGSLAARLERFYDAIDDDSPALDTVYEYRCRHGLRLAYRGTDLPDMYIGLNGRAHEISCVDSANWSYEIDLPRFLAEVTSIRVTKGSQAS